MSKRQILFKKSYNYTQTAEFHAKWCKKLEGKEKSNQNVMSTKSCLCISNTKLSIRAYNWEDGQSDFLVMNYDVTEVKNQRNKDPFKLYTKTMKIGISICSDDEEDKL